MKSLLATVLVALIVALSFSWTFRYAIVVGNDPLTVYSLDRWTGEVSLIAPEPAARSLKSQSLEFVRAPLVTLRGPAYRYELLESLSEEMNPNDKEDRQKKTTGEN